MYVMICESPYILRGIFSGRPFRSRRSYYQSCPLYIWNYGLVLQFQQSISNTVIWHTNFSLKTSSSLIDVQGLYRLSQPGSSDNGSIALVLTITSLFPLLFSCCSRNCKAPFCTTAPKISLILLSWYALRTSNVLIEPSISL